MRRRLRGPAWLLGTTLIALGCASAQAPDLATLTPEQWLEDLEFVLEVLTERHPDIFGYHDVDPRLFAEATETLRRAIPNATPTEVVLALDRLVAMGGDGHTSLDAVQSRAGLSRYPLALGFIGDELRVLGTPEADDPALGAVVLAIDGTPVAEAIRAVSGMISHDNEQEFRYLGPTYLSTGPVLAYLGIVSSAERATFSLARGDSTFDLTLDVWPLDRLANTSFVSAARAAGAESPLFLTRPGETYWFEYLADHQAVYVKWDRINDADGSPSLRRFYRDLFAFVDANPVERLVVDFRHNNGGNYNKARGFLDGLAKRPGLTKPGTLFVLTAPRTFSAATHTAARLKFEANATIVGEASRGNPNYGQNSETAVLPNSRLRMEYTDRLQKEPPFPDLGDARRLPVDLPVRNTFDDWIGGRDRVLETALGEPSSR